MNRTLACIAFSLALVAGACSSGSDNDVAGTGGPGGGPGSGGGRLVVHLTDAPMTGVQAVNVTVANVRIHQSAGAGAGDAGWRDIPVTAAMPVDLMRIQGGVLYELCGANLAAGQYQQVRLVIQQNDGATPPFRNSVMTADGIVHPVDMPSDVKIVHGFTVADGMTTDLTLDFRADKSMRQRGKGEYYMQPVITATSTVK
jgi:hypothetical protein